MYTQKYKNNWYYDILNWIHKPEQWEIDLEGEKAFESMLNHKKGLKITRKHFNIQHIQVGSPKYKKFLKRWCSKKIRKQEISKGNHYRKVNEYRWDID